MSKQYPKLVESKTTANEVANIEWNPGMDLLATVFDTGALTCSRLLSLQKVWHKQSCGKLVSVAWRPDGRVLALGAHDDKTKANICTLYDVEDGKEVHSIKMDCDITSIGWFGCSSPSDRQNEKEDPIKPKRVAPPSSDMIKEAFSHQLAHEQTQLNILMISTSNGRLSYYALGLFYLGYAYVSESPAIYKTHMSCCMQFITSILCSSEPEHRYSTLKVVKFNIFQERSNEILNVARMYAKITDELEYLDDTLSAIKTSWTDVLAGLDNKLSSYCSRRSRKPDESGTSYTFISADDLLQLLVLGHPSDNLEKFLADMSDKGLRKLNNAIEQTCQRVQNLIVKNAQKCCYHLHKDLNQLRGMSLWHQRYKHVGLDDKSIVEAVRDVGSLMLKLTELQQVIDHSLNSTKSFFRWLISIACRITGEQNNSVMPSDVNKTTQQDIQLITDFILENFDYNLHQDDLGSFLSRDGDSTAANESQTNRPTCSNFTLEQVGQYLKNESLTRLKYSFTRPNSNFWIEFFKQRPDITEPKILEEDGSSVLLFYPHRAEMSLVQEHKRAVKSIDTAFGSVAENFKKLWQDSSLVVELQEFIRNAPANRIRVETDVTSMTHHTLFQTKPGPVTKQYLVSQSLTDRSFRLISFEFQTTSLSTSSRLSRLSAQGSTGNIVIADSCFYENKDTRRMLLTFLLNDQASSDTLIVQIELNKLLEAPNCAERTLRDMGKIFRTNETIDKHSSQQILRLDLQTEPACDRKHEPEMMVKKIKGVLGRNMFASSSRGVIAFTSNDNKRSHIYELESMALGPEIVDDEVESDDNIDESLIDTEMLA